MAGFSTTSSFRYCGLRQVGEPGGGATPCDANQPLSMLRQTSPWSIGRHAVLGIELVAVVDRDRAPAASYGSKRPSSRAAREQVVVDPEEHVALRVALREERPVDHLAGVAALEDRQLQAALPLEGGLDRLRDRERVVRDEHDLLARRRAPDPPHAAATQRGHSRERRASAREPCATVVTRAPRPRGPGGRRAGSRASTRDRAPPWPRRRSRSRGSCPAGRVSPRSGYSSPSVVTPSAGPCSGSRETSSPGRARERRACRGSRGRARRRARASIVTPA